MTERKRAEDEIRILNEELEARVHRRTQQLEKAHEKIVKLEKEALEVQMAGGFAHEMRNALVGAKLMLESVVEEDETLCQKNAALLETLYEEITAYLPAAPRTFVFDTFGRLERNEEVLDNMLHLVNHSIIRALGVTTLILEYAKLGRATVGQETIDLRDVIEQLLEEHYTSFAEKGITLRPRLSANAILTGRAAHFYSIINNILLNARDELVEVNDDRELFIEITLRRGEDSLTVTVTDNADGIPQEDLPKIFEPFFSTKPTTGTGLGLSFVSKLVPLYNGTIDVKSTVSEGTTFTLTFPVNENK
jgi:signal transduction histidine kinase